MKVNWYKVGVFSAIAIAIFLFGRKCGSDGTVKGTSNDTATVRVDTLPGFLQVIIDTHYVPQPYKVVQYRPVYRTDTLEMDDRVDIIYLDTTGIVISYYSDTTKIDFGHVIISDTISENRIAGRGVKTNQRLPIIKETVTIFQPPKNIVYLGFSGTGSKQNFFYSIGTDLSLKTRNDRIYSAGVNLTRDNQVLFEGGVKFPIRLKQRVYSR